MIYSAPHMFQCSTKKKNVKLSTKHFSTSHAGLVSKLNLDRRFIHRVDGWWALENVLLTPFKYGVILGIYVKSQVVHRLFLKSTGFDIAQVLQDSAIMTVPQTS